MVYESGLQDFFCFIGQLGGLYRIILLVSSFVSSSFVVLGRVFGISQGGYRAIKDNNVGRGRRA